MVGDEVDTPSLETVYIGGLNATSDNNLFNHFVTSNTTIQIETPITEITISSNSFNEMDVTSYVLRGLNSLLTVVIQDDCFGFVKDVVFENLTSLQSIVIGDGSFYNTTSLSLTSWIDWIELIGSSSINNLHYGRVFLRLHK